MSREFLEETGVITKLTDWRCFFILTNPNNYRVYMFCTYSENFSQVKTVEKEVVRLFSVDQLPKNIIPNLAWLIPLSQDNKAYCDGSVIMSYRL